MKTSKVLHLQLSWHRFESQRGQLFFVKEGNGTYRRIYGTLLADDFPVETTKSASKATILHCFTFCWLFLFATLVESCEIIPCSVPKVDTIVFFTRSLLKQETEEVVVEAIEEFNERYNKNKDFKIEVRNPNVLGKNWDLCWIDGYFRWRATLTSFHYCSLKLLKTATLTSSWSCQPNKRWTPVL